jgi:hypothetical protein
MLCGLPALSGGPQPSLPARAGARPRSPCALPVARSTSLEAELERPELSANQVGGASTLPFAA